MLQNDFLHIANAITCQRMLTILLLYYSVFYQMALNMFLRSINVEQLFFWGGLFALF